MTDLRKLFSEEYKDFSLDISPDDIIAVYKKEKRKTYTAVIGSVCCLFIVLSVINLNTGAVSEFFNSTGEFLSNWINPANPGKNVADTYCTDKPTVKPASVLSTEKHKGQDKNSKTSAASRKPAASVKDNNTLNVSGVSNPEPKENVVYSSPENFEYTLKQDGTVLIKEYKGSEESVRIPNKINGKNVTEIGEKAFASFKGNKVILSDNISVIDSGAFYKNSSIKEIELNNVKEIGSKAFSGCKSIEKLTVPSSVKIINYGAFMDCDNLKALNLNAEYTNEETGPFEKAGYTFSSCDKLETLNVGEGVKTIYDRAFYQCYALKNIKLPKSLRKINSSAFSCCTGLESINLPDGVTFIGQKAFNKCRNLSSVKLSQSLTEICKQAFYNCNALKKITVPASVRNLGSMCLGYYDKNDSETTVTGFTIKCYNDSAAWSYGLKNKFALESMGESPVVTTVKLEKYVVVLNIGGEYDIVYKVDNPVGKTTFSSSDKTIAAVSKNGTVTAKKIGKAEITVTNNKVSRKLIVIVE